LTVDGDSQAEQEGRRFTQQQDAQDPEDELLVQTNIS